MFGAAAMRGVVKALARRRGAYGTAPPDIRKVQDPQQVLGRLARFWMRTRDTPENLVLYFLVTYVIGAGLYTLKRTYLNNFAGAYWKPNIRGDPEKQTEYGRVGIEDPTRGLWSFWFYMAQVKNSPDGPDIGVPPFHNPLVRRSSDNVMSPGWWWPQAGHSIDENAEHKRTSDGARLMQQPRA